MTPESFAQWVSYQYQQKIKDLFANIDQGALLYMTQLGLKLSHDFRIQYEGFIIDRTNYNIIVETSTGEPVFTLYPHKVDQIRAPTYHLTVQDPDLFLIFKLTWEYSGTEN